MNNPAWIYLFKVNNKKHYSNVWNLFKVEDKDTERYHWRRTDVFIVDFKQTSHIRHFLSVSNVYFEQVNGGWEETADFLWIFISKVWDYSKIR